MLTQEKRCQQSKFSTFFSFCMTTSIVMRPWPAQYVNLNLLSLKEPIVIKVCFKTFVTHIIKLITSQILLVKAYFKLLWKVYREEQHQYKQKYENSKRLCCPSGLRKFFFEEIYDSQNSRYETLKIPLLKNVPPTSLCRCHSALNACFYQFILTE